MQTRSRLVLSQYREGSDYSDEIGVRFHFPKKYYNLMTLPDVEFIYYEPGKKGEGVFFGYGEVSRIEPDAKDTNQFFAQIVNYKPFSQPVPGKTDLGEFREPPPFYNPQNSVRQIIPESFTEICREGGVELSALGIENENPESEDTITDPFDLSKIKVDREPMPVFQILRKIRLKEVLLNPEFQRNFVWDSVRRSRLIESALLRLPLPAFYFDGEKANRWTVVDGLQRLSTLYEFMEQKSFRLQGLEYLRSEEGKSFDELNRGLQRDLEDTQLTLYIIRPGTPPDVKFTIFYRINTGGLVLTSQEIRHALFQGRSSDLLRELASSEEFRKATDMGVSDLRMDARECVLRYFAFRIHSYNEYSRSDLNGYLSNVMREMNTMTPERLNALAGEFRDAMTRAYEIFGRFTFRKFNNGSNRRGPVNKALFESWSNVLQHYDADCLYQRKSKLRAALSKAFLLDSDYARSLSAGTGGVKSVKLRFERAHAITVEAIL